jgi:hypothetical protein
MVHKKRLRRDYFLSTMQNCIQPPYSQNHFYAFDQINMLKLQRNLHSTEYDNQHRASYSNLKRKYPDKIDDDESICDCNQTSPSKYSPDKIKSPSQIVLSDELKSIHTEKQEQSENPTSHLILSRLEKILNLCGELRSLAKDVEPHTKELESEQTIIDIYKELEVQQTNTEEINASPPYQGANDTSSIHSNSNKSYQLMVCLLNKKHLLILLFLFSQQNHLKVNHRV